MSQLTQSISSVSNVFLHRPKQYSDRGSVVEKMMSSSSMTGSSLSESKTRHAHSTSGETSSTNVESYSDSSSSKSSLPSSDYSSSVSLGKHIGLTKSENMGIISVLENTIDQLEILGHLLPHSFDKYEGYETLDERHSREGPKSHIYSEEGSTDLEDSLMKVQRDRLFVESVIVRTVLELQKNSSYGPLEEAIQNSQQMQEDDAFLLEEMEANEEEAMRLTDAVSVLEMGQKRAVGEAECAAARLKAHAHETMVEMAIRTRYVRRWEKSRSDQKGFLNNNEEKRLHDDMGQLFLDMDNENRVNQEIETFISITKQELEDSIETWMDLYDREIEDRDKAIISLRMEREVNMRNFLELQEKFEQHRKEMDDWLEIREKRRIRDEQEAFLNKMATRIQAWWRGTMYRNQLGPYRKKKKKKGKGGGKGGNQKGKATKKK